MQIIRIFIYNYLAVTVCSVIGIPSIIDGTLLSVVASMLWRAGGMFLTVFTDFLPIQPSLKVNNLFGDPY